MKFSNLFILAFTLVLATTTVSFAQTVEKNTQLTETTKTIKTKVKGVTCSSDLKTISANVEKLEGVSACTAKKGGATSTFEISYNPALVTEEEIYGAIQETGGCKNPEDRPYKVKR